MTASGKPTDDADNVEDCEAENLAATVVDVAGDKTYVSLYEQRK